MRTRLRLSCDTIKLNALQFVPRLTLRQSQKLVQLFHHIACQLLKVIRLGPGFQLSTFLKSLTKHNFEKFNLFLAFK